MYYFIAQIKIKDTEEYEKYLEKTAEIFQRYQGEYLSVDDAPVIIEGEWDYTRVVVIRFSNKKDFEDWYYSDEYQEILKFRLSAADCNSILISS